MMVETSAKKTGATGLLNTSTTLTESPELEPDSSIFNWAKTWNSATMEHKF